MKIKFNYDLDTIINFINSSTEFIEFKELLQFCISMDLYTQLYLHLEIIEKLRGEHNEKI